MTRTILYVAALTLAVLLPVFESRVLAQEEESNGTSAEGAADSNADSGEASVDASAESQSSDANADAQSTTTGDESASNQSSADVDAATEQSRDTDTSPLTQPSRQRAADDRASAEHEADIDTDRTRTDGDARTYRSRQRDDRDWDADARDRDNRMDRRRDRDVRDDRDRNRDYRGRDRDDSDRDRGDRNFRDRDDRDFRDRDDRDWDRNDRDFRGRDDRNFRGRDDRDFDRGIHFGRRTDRGLLIDDIDRGSFYFSAGLRRGDVIVSLDGRPIRSDADFHRHVRHYHGERAPLIVLRDGRRETIYVEYPEQTVYRERSSGTAYLGVVFDASARDAAVIHTVAPNSPAEESGLERGDLILALNGEEVYAYEDAIDMIRSMRPGDVLQIAFVRGRSEAETEAVLDARPLRTARASGPDVRVEERQPVYVEPAPRGEYDVEIDRRDDDRRLFDRDRDEDGERDRGLLERVLD